MNFYINMSFFKVCIVHYFLLHLFLGSSLESKDIFKHNIPADFSELFLSSDAIPSDKHICCADGQWEAKAFLDFGAALSVPEGTSFFHYNGTGRIAFDGVNRKSYTTFNITAFSPQIPIYSNFTTTTIKDFAKGIMYTIDDDGNCMKESISRDMQIVCVPETARQVSVGEVGSAVVSTYKFSMTSDVSEQITTASVLQTGTKCVPVTLSNAVFDLNDVSHGTVYSIDVLDVVLEIKDPAIFLPPKSCGNDR